MFDKYFMKITLIGSIVFLFLTVHSKFDNKEIKKEIKKEAECQKRK